MAKEYILFVTHGVVEIGVVEDAQPTHGAVGGVKTVEPKHSSAC
jgi:hypothetical protein